MALETRLASRGVVRLGRGGGWHSAVVADCACSVGDVRPASGFFDAVAVSLDPAGGGSITVAGGFDGVGVVRRARRQLIRMRCELNTSRSERASVTA
jgi:hypothetical protein